MSDATLLLSKVLADAQAVGATVEPDADGLRALGVEALTPRRATATEPSDVARTMAELIANPPATTLRCLSRR
jgi:hypothetical protein